MAVADFVHLHVHSEFSDLVRIYLLFQCLFVIRVSSCAFVVTKRAENMVTSSAPFSLYCEF